MNYFEILNYSTGSYSVEAFTYIKAICLHRIIINFYFQLQNNEKMP